MNIRQILHGLSLSGNVAIKEEKVVIFNNKILENRTIVATLFPDDSKEMGLILNKFFPPKGYRQTVKKNLNNKASYSDEISISRGKGWVQSIEFEEDSCAFSYLYGKKESFAVTRWFFKLLTDNVQSFVLDSLELRKASPPKYAASFQLDGTNLPWNVRNLKQTNPKKFKSWVEHVQTAIKGLQDIDAISREDDKHCYLKLSFEGGIKIPSWLVSDGTLRLMAFTILAYLPNLQKTFLIEEPENGIHPKNMEIVFESLSNVKNSQVFLATHSPAIISLLALESLLCFSKTSNGVTDILRGDAHPQLIKWKGEVSLDILHAGGVLE